MSLTELETRILKVASENAGRRLSVEELAQEVGCKPGTIYTRLQQDNFRQSFAEVMRNSVTGNVPEVLNSMAAEATSGDFKAGKLLLEIANVYQERKEIKADIGVHEESPFTNDEEREQFIKATLSKFVAETSEKEDESDDD